MKNVFWMANQLRKIVLMAGEFLWCAARNETVPNHEHAKAQKLTTSTVMEK